MNERIKQLALEAFQPINDIASEGIADRYTFDQAWFQMYNQKFAELIVLQCLTICEELGDKGMDGHYCADAISKTLMDDIRLSQIDQLDESIGIL